MDALSGMRPLLLAALCALATPAAGTSLYVTSIERAKVQVIVNGAAVRTLRLGETSPEGVRLAEIRNGVAVLEAGGRQVALGLGQSTVAETALQADARGQFLVKAWVNRVATAALIDTGATYVVLNLEQARAMGVDFRGARRITAQTANGAAPAWLVTLASVQVGDIALSNVPGAVVEGGADKLGLALIGMSFLRHVEMRRSGNTMVLSRPHLQ